MSETIPKPPSPLENPGAYAPEMLASWYQWLHTTSPDVVRQVEQAYLPPRTYLLYGYADVRFGFESADVDRQNTLSPFLPPRELLRGMFDMLEALPDIAFAMRLPRVTANATGVDHQEVKKAVFGHAQPSETLGFARGFEPMRGRYGSLVQSCVDEVTEDLLALLKIQKRAELAYDFASPLATKVIARVVGFPADVEAEVREWSDAQTALLGRHLTPAELRDGLRGLHSLSAACQELAHQRATAGRDDLASHLLGQGLSVEKTAAVLMNFIAAGYSTTYGSLLNILRRIMADEAPDFREAFAAADQRTIYATVREFLRLETALVGWKVGLPKGLQLPSGFVVPKKAVGVLMPAAANRDPKRLTNPHSGNPNDLYVQRTGVDLTFGSGDHYCMGANLAILEIGMALLALKPHLPSLRLTNYPENLAYGQGDLLFRTIGTMAVKARV